MELNRREHGLVGLRIGNRGASDRVSFRLDLPDDLLDIPSGTLEGPDVAASDLGLPETMPQGDLPETAYRLPTSVIDWIEAHNGFDWVNPATGTGLWLHVMRNHPLLPMVPWERLLTEAGVHVPVFRLPGWLGRPPVAPKRPAIALWMTMPRAKTAYSAVDVLGRIIEAAESLPMPPRVHVFTDAVLADTAAGQLAASSLEATVHDPGTRDPATPTSAVGSEHPWLSWIEESLASTSVDVLHVVGHGYLAGDTPGFATAQSPLSNEDKRWARFVWPNEIAGTMTRIGAAGTVVTAVPYNYSAGALRLLATRLAAERAGPSVFEQLGEGVDADLADIYRLMLAYPVEIPGSTRSLVITANPGHMGIVPQHAPPERSGSRTKLAVTVAEHIEDAPAWAVPVQSQLSTWDSKIDTMAEGPRSTTLRLALDATKQRIDALLVADETGGAVGEVEA